MDFSYEIRIQVLHRHILLLRKAHRRLLKGLIPGEMRLGVHLLIQVAGLRPNNLAAVGRIRGSRPKSLWALAEKLALKDGPNCRASQNSCSFACS
jgi:hypothetical protein